MFYFNINTKLTFLKDKIVYLYIEIEQNEADKSNMKQLTNIGSSFFLFQIPSK